VQWAELLQVEEFTLRQMAALGQKERIHGQQTKLPVFAGRLI
jgi:hypothetical protein